MPAFEPIFAFVRTIPAGKVLSYGEVGQVVGVTARTVGWAMSDCPANVPWHRVVGYDGSLRTARRSPEIYTEQRKRLTDEGVRFTDNGRVVEDCFWSQEEAFTIPAS